MTRRRRLLVGIAFLTMIADGLDITIPGFVYPQIVEEWGTSLGAVTATVTIGVLAMALGGAVAGPIADRHGRRPATLAGVVLFGLATAGMGLAGSIEVFTALRIVACVGLGATMPVVLAVVADAVPRARRAQLVTLTFAGVSVGTIVGGFLAAALVPAFGWQVLLLVCGLTPLLLVPGLAALVEEPEATRTADAPGGAVGVVLSRQLIVTTLLVWLCFFIGIGVVFLILNYLPLMVRGSGLGAGEAGVLIAVFGWGGLVGQLLVAFALRRFDRFRVLALLWAGGTVGLWVIAALSPGFPGLVVLLFVLGLALPGANGALQAIGALAYPPHARATGMGWTSAVGRLGTLASGLLGGLVVGAGWTLGAIFLALGVPLLAGACAAFGLRAETRRRGDTDAATPAPAGAAS
ncbi:MFS transporter [Pseudonocardia zijingensis]|uniref:Aromatic acid/H+ symport family MFS transporter n=1 Tax=Pseudonocardia zijingensis TaxID=153376 RepID=A0ABP3YLY5_9PSEU